MQSLAEHRPERRAIAIIAPGNARSFAVAERLGLQDTGVDAVDPRLGRPIRILAGPNRAAVAHRGAGPPATTDSAHGDASRGRSARDDG